MEEMNEVVQVVLIAQGICKSHFVGHSMGGVYVTLALVEKNPKFSFEFVFASLDCNRRIRLIINKVISIRFEWMRRIILYLFPYEGCGAF